MASFLEPLLGKLVSLVMEEVELQRGVSEELEGLIEKLEMIQPLLRHADSMTEPREEVKRWVNQLRDVADRIDSVLASYLYRVREINSESGPMAWIFGPIHSADMVWSRHQIYSDIQSINGALTKLEKWAKYLKFGSSGQSGLMSTVVSTERGEPRLDWLLLKEEDLVGIEDARGKIVEHLVSPESERLVISIEGEGGIGKTALCNSVLEHKRVKEHFKHHVWITVSTPYDNEKILKEIIDKIPKESSDNSTPGNTFENQVIWVNRHLENKRYLFVFDDVWDDKFWKDMNAAFPNGKEGSRILITTRNRSVANSRTTNDLVHSLERWSEELASELFCKKAFRDGKCPEKLNNISMEIVRKCQGLPLVISAIASLMATKEKAPVVWQRVLDDLNAKVEISSKLSSAQKILSLSYYDLPHNLRSCFLSFGMFPHVNWISDERLHRLWIAEGFIESKGGKALGEVAKEYMNELSRRNLVLLSQKHGTGEGKYFRVQGLMHDVLSERAKELCFFKIWDSKKSKFKGKGHRAIISSCSESEALKALKNVKSKEIRSLVLSNVSREDAKLTEPFMVTLLKEFKLLEVLDVENVPVDGVPSELGRLFSLKYLSLRGKNVKSLPSAICKLQNLHSLDIRDTSIRELPIEINELRKLEHILAYSYNLKSSSSFDYVVGVSVQLGFGNLGQLQTLTTVDAHRGGAVLMKELAKLRKLSWRGISKLTAENGEALCDAIGRMKHLERLFIAAADENEKLALKNVQSPSLRELVLTGKLEMMPEWIPNLHNLRGLSLTATKLTSDHIKPLKDLPDLDDLQLLRGAYEGEELHFEDGGFKKLRRLSIFKLDTLKAVKFDEKGLPGLEHLDINDCKQLSKVAISKVQLDRMKTFILNGKSQK